MSAALQPPLESERSIVCPKCDGTGRIRMSFGMLVQQRRKALGMTQEALSEKIGLTRPQLANIEAGTHNTDLRRLRDFAAALDCQLDDLIP